VGSRTQDLPPLSGLPHLVRELRHQEAARQSIGVAMIPVYALLAHPQLALFAAGAVLVLLGVLVRLYASGYIVKNKALATAGPYSLVRHPLYTGNLLLLLGFTAANGTGWAVLLSAAFWWFYYPPTIDYEDRKLRRLFGEDCAAWQATVPAVIPRRFVPAPGGHWSLRTSLTRNLEPVIVAWCVFWLGWIGRAL
jgi:protein-S-isoprenylcysteine O-methyltransferase Ste14